MEIYEYEKYHKKCRACFLSWSYLNNDPIVILYAKEYMVMTGVIWKEDMRKPYPKANYW